MITYTVTYSDIKKLFKEEVSKQAAFNAVGKEGESLYGSVMAFSRDDDLIERSIDDAAGNIAARLADICTFNGTTLSFNAPDFITDNESLLSNEIDRYLSTYAVSLWMQDRFADKGEYYLNIANAALAKIVRLVRTRKMPE